MQMVQDYHKKAQEEWEQVKEKGNQISKEELLDYNDENVPNDN